MRERFCPDLFVCRFGVAWILLSARGESSASLAELAQAKAVHTRNRAVRAVELHEQLQRYNDRICNMIFHEDIEWIDVEIQIEQMRELCRSQAPEKLELFEMLYASRFRRLWQSWGRGNELPGWSEVEEEE